MATPVRVSAFAEPAFRHYFWSSCLSTLATWVLRFLLGWSAWALTGTATWVGIVSAAMLLPTFLLSPVFGVVSDRINPRNGMLLTLCGQGLVAAAAGTAELLGVFGLGPLLLLTRIRLAARAPASGDTTLMGELVAGLSFVRSDQRLRVILAFTLLNGLLGRTVIELLPAISGKLLAGTASTLAALTATAGAGAILGGLLLARRRNAGDGLLRLVVWAQVAGSLSLLPIAWATSTLRLGAIVFALSMAMTMALGLAADRLGFPPILLGAALLVAGASVSLYRSSQSNT